MPSPVLSRARSRSSMTAAVTPSTPASASSRSAYAVRPSRASMSSGKDTCHRPRSRAVTSTRSHLLPGRALPEAGSWARLCSTTLRSWPGSARLGLPHGADHLPPRRSDPLDVDHRLEVVGARGPRRAPRERSAESRGIDLRDEGRQALGEGGAVRRPRRPQRARRRTTRGRARPPSSPIRSTTATTRPSRASGPGASGADLPPRPTSQACSRRRPAQGAQSPRRRSS